MLSLVKIRLAADFNSKSLYIVFAIIDSGRCNRTASTRSVVCGRHQRRTGASMSLIPKYFSTISYFCSTYSDSSGISTG